MPPIQPPGKNRKPEPSTSTATDAFSALEVIDKLIVGPIKLEPRRLTAAYTVVRNGTENRTDLIYSYEEKGERIWETMVAHLVALVEDLKNMTLDDIYHRRY